MDGKTEMMLTPGSIARAVYSAISKIAVTLRSDYRKMLKDILKGDDYKGLPEVSLDVIRSILDNARIGEEDHVPICQDTGSVWVCLEMGPDVIISGDIFSEVDDAVSRAYSDNHLRMSIVNDAIFDRSNTEHNTPAFCEIRVSDREGARVHVLLKGGGSDNASRVLMLSPDSGEDGVVDAIIECVKEKAVNACPPLVLGVGIGSTFDKVASLAKFALLKPVNCNDGSSDVTRLEKRILEKVNELNIGPAGLGGKPTALAVNIITSPCHIASLPLAINMGCCAMRSETMELGR